MLKQASLVRMTILAGGFITLVNALIIVFVNFLGQWQPSTEIAYLCPTANRQGICLIDADRGHIYQLPLRGYKYTNVGKLSWSPHGDKLAFYGYLDNLYGIYVVDLTAIQSPKLVALKGYSPAWSPDGNQIIYSVYHYFEADRIIDHSPSPDRVDLYTLDLVTGVAYPLITEKGTFNWNATWSPDGTQIAFQSGLSPWSRNYDIYVAKADGTNRQRIMRAEAATDNTFFDPAWSPDATQIAVFSGRNWDRDIVILDLNSGEQQQWENNWGYDGSPSWSPDGKRIVYDSDRWRGYWTPDSERWAIYISKADGSDTYYVAVGSRPAWRP